MSTELVFNHTLHQKFWNYLSIHPGISKEKAIHELAQSGRITQDEYTELRTANAHCLACEYALKKEKLLENTESRNCEYCPFVGMTGTSHNCLSGTFYAWWHVFNYSSLPSDLKNRYSRRYAETIANWPVKEDVVCI